MAINRIMQFDQQSLDSGALWNAQRNLNLFAKTNLTNIMNNSDISSKV